MILRSLALLWFVVLSAALCNGALAARGVAPRLRPRSNYTLAAASDALYVHRHAPDAHGDVASRRRKRAAADCPENLCGSCLLDEACTFCLDLTKESDEGVCVASAECSGARVSLIIIYAQR